MQIADFVDAMARRVPYQAAVIFPEGRDRSGRVSYTHLTYQQLAYNTGELALKLSEYGIAKGDRVALMVKPCLEFFTLTFSLFKLGAVPVFIDPGIGRHYLGACLRDAAPSAFIGIPKAQIARLMFGWERGKLKHVITVGSSFGFGGITLDFLKARPGKTSGQLPELEGCDTAAILFTSGSTGAPKGAVYKHSNFMAQVRALQTTYAIQPGEIDLCTFPLFALFAPALGMTALIPDMDFTRPGQVDPVRLFEPLENFEVRNLFGSPALLAVLADACLAKGFRLPTLKRVISAGAPVPFPVLSKLKPALAPEAEIFTPYGATEALPIASMGASEILAETARRTKEGFGICVGRPVAGVAIKIIGITDNAISDDSSVHFKELESYDVGEIVVSGPQVTEAYFNKPEATALAKISGGAPGKFWHRMGDVGYKDDQGRLWFCGRKTHRVESDQGVMYTIPCEGIFNNHPKVRRTALVGVGIPRRETPVLCVEIPKDQKSARDTLRSELRSLGLKNPKTATIEQFIFVDRFPVDTRHNSKIFREKLRVLAEKELNR